MIFSEKVLERRKLESRSQEERQKFKENLANAIRFVKNEIDKFVNDERYSQYKLLLESWRDDLKDKQSVLSRNVSDVNQLAMEHCRIEGQIEVLTDIIDLPRNCKKSLEKLLEKKGEKYG